MNNCSSSNVRIQESIFSYVMRLAACDRWNTLRRQVRQCPMCSQTGADNVFSFGSKRVFVDQYLGKESCASHLRGH